MMRAPDQRPSRLSRESCAAPVFPNSCSHRPQLPLIQLLILLAGLLKQQPLQRRTEQQSDRPPSGSQPWVTSAFKAVPLRERATGSLWVCQRRKWPNKKKKGMSSENNPISTPLQKITHLLSYTFSYPLLKKTRVVF